MSNSFTQVFGGTTIYPADVSYLALALTGNISLEWPLEATAGSSVVARIIDITPSGAYTITMPEATSVSVGQTVLFNNIGPSTVAVNKANGSAILSIGAGEQWQAYLIDNTTPGGTWRTLRYGAATAQAQAAALAGPGLVTDGSQLAQNYEVIDFSVTPYTLTAPDRAKVFIWDGGLGTLNLPSAPAAGDGWFVQVRNAGQGDLTVDPSGSELINAGSTLLLQPGDSAVIVSNGTQWYTIGLGQQAVFAFDYTSIAVTGGTYTLSGSELNRIAYKFTGALASNVTIVVPATVQQYWVNNSTTGPFTLSLQASGSGSSTPVTQSSTSILYCDGTAIVPATTAVTFAGILPVSQGGTGANNAPSARTNLGATGIGSSLFTATSAASARSTISAASSGANSDITSLSGLTTPLSVGQGGTGAATLTANGVVVGNGTSAVQVTAAGTTGQVLVGNTGGAPSWATLTGIGVTSFSGGTTGLTPASPTTGAITLAGTLGVANGGTGTATAFTAGSVVFAGASGVYSQDNANLFWDNANDRLGIGTATPDYQLHLGGQTVGAVTGSLALGDVAGTPSALVQGLRGGLGDFAGSLLLSTTTGAGSVTERMRIDSVGNVGIGTSSPATRLSVAGTVTVTDGTIDMSTGYSIRWGGAASGIYAGSGTQDMVFTVGSSERMRVNGASGNVGIGTSAPDTTLHVQSATGQIRVQNTTSGTALIGFRNSTTTDVPWVGTGGDDIRIITQSAERMRITSAGLIGIGTTSPGYRLDVANSDGSALARFKDSDSTYNGVIIAGDINGGWVGNNLQITGEGIYYQNAINTMRVYTNSLERMRIDSTGLVGIGTTSPSQRLDVTVSSGTEGVGLGVTNSLGGGYGSGINFYSFRTDNTTKLIAGAIQMFGQANWADATNTSSNMRFSTVLNNTLAERMRITAEGNVGIGVTSPTAKLHIDAPLGGVGNALILQNTSATIDGRGAALNFRSSTTDIAAIDGLTQSTTTSGRLRFFTANSGTLTERMQIDSAGNLGLGVTPTAVSNYAVFDIKGRATGQSTLINFFDGAGTPTGSLQSDTNYGFLAGTSGARPFAVFTNGSERMIVTGAGNVGIGTSAPTVYTGYTSVEIDGASNGGILGIKKAGSVIGYLNGASGLLLLAQSNDLKLTTTGATSMQFSTNASERMRINSTGIVGIGVVPSANDFTGTLQTGWVGHGITPRTSTNLVFNMNANHNAGDWRYGNTGAAALYIQSDTGHAWYNAPSGTAGNVIAFTEAMRITSAGNVGIGTSSPAQKFVVSDAGANGFEFDASTGILQTYNRGTSAYTDMRLYSLNHRIFTGSSPTEKMRVTSAGDVGVGTTSPAFYGGRVVSNADGASIAMFAANNSDAGSASQTVFDIYRNGTRTGSITNTNAATAYNTSSDERLKHDIVNAPSASGIIDAIKVRSFKWNADNSEQRYGFVAQELLTVAPEAVSVPADPDDMMGVDYSKLVPMLVKEIQSLRARVAQLEGK